ncbi:hypothetical protein PAXRUDRAFT_830360, partial [Paxillus rubicundulus Ve08.2h10]
LFEVSIAILFISDYFYKLEDELTLVWSRRGWSVGKALFVLTRYIPWVIIPVMLFSTFTTNLDVHTCKTVLYFLVVLDAVAIALSEAIFSFRVYAMWNRNMTVLVILCCTTTVLLVALIYIFQSYLPSVTCKHVTGDDISQN